MNIDDFENVEVDMNGIRIYVEQIDVATMSQFNEQRVKAFHDRNPIVCQKIAKLLVTKYTKKELWEKRIVNSFIADAQRMKLPLPIAR